MNLFKGYIKCKGKKAIEAYKNVDKYRTLDEVKAFDSYAGVLAEDVILVDIDDKTQSEILMNIVEDLQLNCRVYQTSRCTRHCRKSMCKIYGVCRICSDT